MKISFDEVILRDYQLSDVEDEVRWTNTDTAWFYSDTPWMTLEPVDPDELRADMLDVMSGLSENAIRWRFEIEVAGQHIGMVSSYYLDENFEPTPWESIDQCKNAEENRSIRGLGIEICEMSFWGRGISGKALTAFMEYYRSLGEHRFFLETWSGNARMLGCAGKLGFSEVKRQKGTYVVDDKAYDGLVLEKRIIVTGDITMHYSIRKVTLGDESTLAFIQTESWKAAFAQIIPAELLEKYTNIERATAMYKQLLLEKKGNGYILSVEGKPHCIAWWDTSREKNMPGYAEIICIHSLKDNWRQGYGSKMVDKLLSDIASAGYAKVMLWVFEANERARKFYEAKGFHATDIVQPAFESSEICYELIFPKNDR